MAAETKDEKAIKLQECKAEIDALRINVRYHWFITAMYEYAHCEYTKKHIHAFATTVEKYLTAKGIMVLGSLDTASNLFHGEKKSFASFYSAWDSIREYRDKICDMWERSFRPIKVLA